VEKRRPHHSAMTGYLKNLTVNVPVYRPAAALLLLLIMIQFQVGSGSGKAVELSPSRGWAWW